MHHHMKTNPSYIACSFLLIPFSQRWSHNSFIEEMSKVCLLSSFSCNNCHFACGNSITFHDSVLLRMLNLWVFLSIAFREKFIIMLNIGVTDLSKRNICSQAYDLVFHTLKLSGGSTPLVICTPFVICTMIEINMCVHLTQCRCMHALAVMKFSHSMYTFSFIQVRQISRKEMVLQINCTRSSGWHRASNWGLQLYLHYSSLSFLRESLVSNPANIKIFLMYCPLLGSMSQISLGVRHSFNCAICNSSCKQFSHFCSNFGLLGWLE